MQDISQGQERVRVWPRKRGRPKSATTREQNRLFRDCQWAAKYWHPDNMKEIDGWRRGTPVLPRDIQTAMMMNRMFIIDMLDGRRLYPVTVVKDVSDALDAFGQVPGSLLVRGEELWTLVNPPPGDNFALVYDEGEMQWVPFDGGLGNLPWYWNPPAAADFATFAKPSGNNPTLIDDDDLGLVLVSNNASDATFRSRMALKPVPASGAFEVEAHIRASTYTVSTQACGLYLYESGTNKIQFAGIECEGNTRYADSFSGTYTAFTTRGSRVQNAPYEAFIRLGRDSSNNIYVDWSLEGKHWMRLRSVAQTGPFTVKPTHIGIGFSQATAGTDVEDQSLVIDRWLQTGF
jgi:hypothetical protein